MLLRLAKQRSCLRNAKQPDERRLARCAAVARCLADLRSLAFGIEQIVRDLEREPQVLAVLAQGTSLARTALREDFEGASATRRTQGLPSIRHKPCARLALPDARRRRPS
jgi:hypothetical protein